MTKTKTLTPLAKIRKLKQEITNLQMTKSLLEGRIMHLRQIANSEMILRTNARDDFSCGAYQLASRILAHIDFHGRIPK